MIRRRLGQRGPWRCQLVCLLVAAGAWWAAPLCAGEASVTVTPSASYAFPSDSLPALCDGKEPRDSNDHDIPRLTFWKRLGTTEWVQYDFDAPTEVSSVEVYWFDDSPGGGCRVPEAWTVLYNTGYVWVPVGKPSAYGVARDRFNRVTFEPVVTASLRIEVRQPEGKASGILEWKLNGRTPKLGSVGYVGSADPIELGFSYARTWLALAAWVKAAGETDPEAKAALVRLEAQVEALVAARTAAGFGDVRALGAWKEAADRLAAIGKQYPVDAVLLRLDERSPQACLELMIRLDWLAQDLRARPSWNFLGPASRVIDGLGPGAAPLVARREKLLEANTFPGDRRWMDLYLEACGERRRARMGPHVARFPKIVFTKHHDIGGQHYAYTEAVSDSPYDDNDPFPPGGALCLVEMDGLYGTVRTLIDEPDGLVRDPDVSYDGRRVLFAWRKSMTDDDYHLYEMTVADGTIRQLTFGRGVADYEGAYLPGGDIVFNSTRCQQIVDCWWSDVSNLYTCDADGRYLRRLGFDQVHTNYPQVMPDGRVIYTRWDYNDRGQLFPQPLFQMNADGTGQTDFYGNNSWFPTTILHARGIPGTPKVLCVLSGHHTYQKGKLAIVDPGRGRRENQGVQLVAPVRPTEAVKVDMYGYQGEQFQYPYPLSETEFLVTFSTEGSEKARDQARKPFGVYFMTIEGERELLAADPKISCSQPVPVVARPEPPARPRHADYRKQQGVYYVQDVYAGPGLAGVARGTIRRLRVVALEFRAAGVGSNRNKGPAGAALISTPISINGAWDVKRVLGTAKVYDDGSAAFTVPARTPIYFQALDEKGHAVQTMRSWSTLQPGERFSCVGCHEHKNTAPPAAATVTQAMKAGPQELVPFEPSPTGRAGGFSFPKRIQPILDRHCTDCHNRRTVAQGESTISLEGTGTLDPESRKHWSDAYRALADPKLCRWVSPQSAPPMLPPYHAGASQSKLIRLLEAGHEDCKLSPQEMRRIACWIDLAVPFSGDYTEAMDAAHVPTYLRWLGRRKHWAEEEGKNIEALIASRKEK